MCPETPERAILHDSQAPIEAVLEAAGVLCPNGNERTIDPETQARLEAVLEAAGVFQIFFKVNFDFFIFVDFFFIYL